MRILNTGYVGIGTTTPTAQLSIVNSGTTGTSLLIDQSNPAFTGSLLNLKMGGSSKFIVDAWGNLQSGGQIYAWGKLRLSGSAAIGYGNITQDGPTDGLAVNGNVGIGTSTPSGILDVQGGTAAASTAGKAINLIAQSSGAGASNTGGAININSGAGAGGHPYGNINFNVGTGAAGRVNITRGITNTYASTGTGGSPSLPGGLGHLHLDNGYVGNNNGTLITSKVVNSTPQNQYGYFGFISSAGAGNYSPTFVIGRTTGSSAWAETFRIDQSGNIGIGTASPNSPLTVNGDITPATSGSGNLGNSSYLWNTVYATTGTINTSDRREKTDIRDADLGLDFINALRPVSYRWKSGAQPGTYYGLIAQELEEVLRGKSFSGLVHDEKTDKYGIRYTELIAPLIKAVQEFHQKWFNDSQELREELAQVRSENAQLRSWICRQDPSAPFCVSP